MTARRRDYITREGWQRLANERAYLWRDKRPRVVRALADAAAEGDRSENAEYTYRKKELREIDRRLRYLGKRLDELSVANSAPDDPNRVFFGAWVEVIDAEGQRHCYRIVGADETDATTGAISLHSPMARALLGRAAGDVVSVQLPGQRREFEIEAVRYQPSAP
jgi:transcription elongation factor GreB